MKTSKYHNLIRMNLLTWIIVAIMLGLSIQSKAQSGNKNTLLQMIGEDRTTIDAIAGYDQKVQRNILQVAQTPEVLNKIEELQKRSQNQFRAIIDDYDRDAQAAFYEMARYPSLISDLVRNGKPSSSEVNQIVSNYPKDIHATASNYARRYYDVLRRIDQLNSEIDRAFQLYLEPYNEETRESVNALLAYPEIVSILVEDKDFTALLGAVYNDDPEWLENRLGQISQELAEQNKEDLDAYKNQIQNDPEAYNEMLEASDKFARENNEVRYLNNSSDPIVEVRVVNSYPYWFGYPYWYSDPYWRPRPFYYHTGFYRNNFGAVVFVGLPSYHFMHWQTYNHPTLFPHLSYNYYSYYENHYVNRYRDSHRPVPHHGFYRSIEANVINNPRVNNSNLERIDHQRGNNIVRRPNTMESGSTRRGGSGNNSQREISNSRQAYGIRTPNSRQVNGTINRNGNEQRSSETSNGAINRRGNEQNNSGNSGNVNRRQYNTVNPGRSEGSYNSKGMETHRGSVQREGSSVTNSPVERTTERSSQGTSLNNSRYERPRTNGTNFGRSGENVSPSAMPQRTSSDNPVNRVQPQQQSAAPQQRRETSAPAERTERAAPVRQAQRVERTSAPERREPSSAPVQRAGRSEQRESRAANSQSSNTRASGENRSSERAASSGNSNRERSNGRRE